MREKFLQKLPASHDVFKRMSDILRRILICIVPVHHVVAGLVILVVPTKVRIKY